MNKIAGLLVFFVLLDTSSIKAQAPVFKSVTPNSSTIQKLEKFELKIDLIAGYSNAYDYDDIAVQCIFTTPSGKKDTVDGFYMEHYNFTTDSTINSKGYGNFSVRYTPVESGNYSYQLSCINKEGKAVYPAKSFKSTDHFAKGFVRKNTTNYLSFDDGAQYIPVGENMCWQQRNVVNDYTKWLTKLTDNGGNFIRLWMPDWSFGFEWKNGKNGFEGLKKYKQSSAFYLDWLLEYCKEKSVYMMLCLNHHGQVSTGVNPEWKDNPYNAANGGPCNNTWDFFTNATAKDLIKNRMRYIVARYGYSQNIMSWELFNEVEWTDQYETHKNDVKNWHGEMAAFLKNIDVNKHLVTTSFAHDHNDAGTWNLEDIDFTQTHYYAGVSNPEKILSAGSRDYLLQYDKPTLNGEFGINAQNISLGTIDPKGVYIHNSIWATAFSGAMGTAMTWWWDNYIDPKNLYVHYKPLSRLINSLALKEDNYKYISATISGGSRADLYLMPGKSWGAATAPVFHLDEAGNINPQANQLGQFLYGRQSNTQYRNPPTFHLNYPAAAKFIIETSDAANAPVLDIYVDGKLILSQPADKHSAYSIDVPAGLHSIKVDNSGADWIGIANYTFQGLGAPLSSYVLKAANNSKAAGWILNDQYNWKYLQDHQGEVPAAVSGATITVPGMQNGSYQVQLYNCSTGDVIQRLTVKAVNERLTISLPAIEWDLAFTASRQE